MDEFEDPFDCDSLPDDPFEEDVWEPDWEELE